MGPRYRGKFNAEKAAELGVFKRDRASLARGESVTVQVEVDGKTVSRTVTPDQVLSESDPPAVGWSPSTTPHLTDLIAGCDSIRCSLSFMYTVTTFLIQKSRLLSKILVGRPCLVEERRLHCSYCISHVRRRSARKWRLQSFYERLLIRHTCTCIPLRVMETEIDPILV